MKKNKLGKLRLDRQAIRVLLPGDLALAAGASDTSVNSGYTICITRIRTLCTTVISDRCTIP